MGEEMSNLSKLQKDQGEWADETFGGGRNPRPILNHLRREVDEAIADPFDPMEYADILLLLVDAARNAGITGDEMIDYAYRKLEINKSRKWGSPNPDGSIEHIKEGIKR